MQATYRNFLIRDWQPPDRQAVANHVQSILVEYGLANEPVGADQDVLTVEDSYWAKGGEFWVIETQGRLVGTAGYYPVARGENAVEIRKMYLRSDVRGQGLGRYLLQALEAAIATQGYTQIWIQTASILKEAVQLYERNGYQPSTGIETDRCDRIYVKSLSAQ
ncbi:MAG: GNAT family N-acetyltransferase [Leptolyngbyaceae cyanobacterium CSU_1_4]|nr:GNAT family N-acetyltransferase [Leptolyngbyaceae cyanobacterium CSU_1_4]